MRFTEVFSCHVHGNTASTPLSRSREGTYNIGPTFGCKRSQIKKRRGNSFTLRKRALYYKKARDSELEVRIMQNILPNSVSNTYIQSTLAMIQKAIHLNIPRTYLQGKMEHNVIEHARNLYLMLMTID